MKFFTGALKITDTNYKIRNALIDYFSEVDTLSTVIDNRFYKIE